MNQITFVEDIRRLSNSTLMIQKIIIIQHFCDPTYISVGFQIRNPKQSNSNQGNNLRWPERERERERESPDHFFYRVLKNRFGVIDGKSERRFHSFLFRFNKTRGLRRNLCRFPHRFLRRRRKFPNNYHRRSLLGTRAIITGALRSRTLLGLPIFIESPFVFNLCKPLSSCCPS